MVMHRFILLCCARACRVTDRHLGAESFEDRYLGTFGVPTQERTPLVIAALRANLDAQDLPAEGSALDARRILLSPEKESLTAAIREARAKRYRENK